MNLNYHLLLAAVRSIYLNMKSLFLSVVGYFKEALTGLSDLILRHSCFEVMPIRINSFHCYPPASKEIGAIEGGVLFQRNITG